jgi:signal transduction histidine kinase
MSLVSPHREVGGVTGAVARFIAPEEFIEGQLTGLLGTLWATGGAWLLAAWVLGVFDDGWWPGVVAVAGAAVVIGLVLLALHRRRLGAPTYLALTLLGAGAITLATLWGGPTGTASVGVLYAYVSCFSFIALRRYAVRLVAASAMLHLLALVVRGDPDLLGIWVLTWGAVTVTGLLAGAAVDWLRQAVALLEEEDETRTRFVAMVTHELRTPLTAILGSTETLQRRWTQLDDAGRRAFVAVIDRQAARQLRLVNDVLAMSAVMSGTSRSSVRPVEVAELVEQALESVPFPVEVDVPASLAISVDPIDLRQVLENLLMNADRYGAPPLIVRARAGEPVRIDVIDHGPGIPGGFDGGVLEPFVQGDSGDRRRSSGVGLGLTICRELSLANGVGLEYADTPGGGATIRLWCPPA